MFKLCLRLLLVAVICQSSVLAAEEDGETKAGYLDLVSADDEGALIDEFAFLMEEDVVESAAKHRQDIGMSPSAITVITRQDIEASGANTIADLLRMVPGMDVVVAAPGLQAIAARMYWTEENIHYLVLVDGRLNISLDLYMNRYRNMTEMISDIVADAQGLPDLDLSAYQYGNVGRELDIFGSELAVRYEVSEHLYLRASWAHREAYCYEIDAVEDRSPKNLVVLGGRFNLDSGLLGSLYIHTRSEFTDLGVENPAGMLAGGVARHMENVVLAKLG